jgi:hypothetical protein
VMMPVGYRSGPGCRRHDADTMIMSVTATRSCRDLCDSVYTSVVKRKCMLR